MIRLGRTRDPSRVRDAKRKASREGRLYSSSLALHSLLFISPSDSTAPAETWRGPEPRLQHGRQSRDNMEDVSDLGATGVLEVRLTSRGRS